ncbi:hypothetical protein [Pseudokineococcus lusitanus]|uniref:hypothetical protein n=1 Tax=Pseudokineococcus lusitanus TaxID=763993 RepID=UPI0011CECDCC|nr:hypothetical protein [Pseudokineococcus lusitanus]
MSTTDDSPPRDASGRFTSTPEAPQDGPPFLLQPPPPGAPPGPLTDDPHYRDRADTAQEG